jgi:hypothetical protein
MKTDKYIKSISFKIGGKTITAGEAKKLMNDKEYKIKKSVYDRIEGGNNYEK